jgi:hypothetical protein
VNEEWVDTRLNQLTQKLGILKHYPDEFGFEPTENIYRKLESGDEQDLQYVATEIARYLIIAPAPTVKYDWGLKMEPEVAGQIKVTPQIHEIRIPFFYVGKRYELGAILAHEMTHAFLFSRGIFLEDPNENEMFTDLAIIFIGLGKLFINGLINLTNKYSNEANVLGYLPPELIAYCYKKVNMSRHINEDAATRNLTPEAVKHLQTNFK